MQQVKKYVRKPRLQRERAANDIRGKKSQCREREKASRGYESQSFGGKLEKKEKEWSVMMLVKSPEKKKKKPRRSGAETIAYLNEKSEKEFKIKQEELELKKQGQCAQVKRQEEMTQQLIHQQEQQQTMFANLQQQQHQQLQQLSQMQMTIMQQQQQQQALVAVLQELAKKK